MLFMETQSGKEFKLMVAHLPEAVFHVIFISRASLTAHGDIKSGIHYVEFNI